MPRPFPPRRRTQRAAAPHALDPLEPRTLLAAAVVTSTIADGVWQVRGTRRADAIVIDVDPADAAALRLTANGVVLATQPAAALSSIEVFAGGGNDNVTVDAGGTTVRVLGERGRDTLTGGPSAETLEGGPGPDALTGNGGNDTLDGGPGNDVLTGGAGADALRGGRGRDRIHRQGGVDASPRDPLDRVAADGDTGALTRLADDAALRAWLTDTAVRQYSWAFGQPAWGWWYAADAFGHVTTAALGAPAGVPPGSAPSPDAPAPSDGAAGEGFSRTNTQVQGVDEADVVETDGEFVYTTRVLSRPLPPQPVPPVDGEPIPELPWQDELVIADAAPADAMGVVSRTTIEGSSLGMYLVGTRLAVLSTIYPNVGVVPVTDGAPDRFVAPGGAAVVDPGRPRVKLTVFDVADRAAPALVEETYFDGSYDGSRAVGDRVYLVVRNDTWAPFPETVEGPDKERLYESEAAYRARLDAMTLSDLLPDYTAKVAGGAESSAPLVAAPDVYVKDPAAATIGQNMASVAVLSIGDAAAGPLDTTTIAGWAASVYASPAALYLSSGFWDGEGADVGQRTNVFKFALEQDSVPLVAAGEVEGFVLNQFSLDEDADGRLRIATTTGFGPDRTSGVYVLRQDDETLTVMGKVTGLGKNQDVRSARFLGDRAYLVTFERVDPLHAIDLSNPARPRQTGELEIPGFSTYLHPLDDGLLIGVGLDTDATGRPTGTQISLFDVSDDTRPRRIAAYQFEGDLASASTAAGADHLAFNYFPEQQILAIPLMAFPPGAEPRHWLQTFHVSRADGIEPRGEIEHAAPVLRSLRIGDVLYSLTPDELKAVQLLDPSVAIANVSLRRPDET